MKKSKEKEKQIYSTKSSEERNLSFGSQFSFFIYSSNVVINACINWWDVMLNKMYQFGKASLIFICWCLSLWYTYTHSFVSLARFLHILWKILCCRIISISNKIGDINHENFLKMYLFFSLKLRRKDDERKKRLESFCAQENIFNPHFTTHLEYLT